MLFAVFTLCLLPNTSIFSLDDVVDLRGFGVESWFLSTLLIGCRVQSSAEYAQTPTRGELTMGRHISSPDWQSCLSRQVWQ